MFEKEAEENSNQFIKTHSESDKFINCKRETDNYNVILAQGYELGFQKGAEFGYNKANEWHKADEKPKVTKEYLVYLISGYNCRSVNMMIYNAERGFWCADNQSDVVYWKEIVLPKESE